MYASSSFTVFDSTRLIGTENEDSGLPGVGTAAGTSAMGSITADIHGMVFFDMDEDICMMPTTENDTQVRRPPSPTSPKVLPATTFAYILSGFSSMPMLCARFPSMGATRALFPDRQNRLRASASLGNLGAKHV